MLWYCTPYESSNGVCSVIYLLSKWKRTVHEQACSLHCGQTDKCPDIFPTNPSVLVTFHCCDKTPWPKATWGRKNFLNIKVTVLHWGKWGQELKKGRSLGQELMQSWTNLTNFLPTACSACFLWHPAPPVGLGLGAGRGQRGLRGRERVALPTMVRFPPHQSLRNAIQACP